MTETSAAPILSTEEMGQASLAMANAVRFAQELLNYIEDVDDLDIQEMDIRSMAINNGLLAERVLTEDEAINVRSMTPDADIPNMVISEFTGSFLLAIDLLDAAEANGDADASKMEMESGTIQ